MSRPILLVHDDSALSDLMSRFIRSLGMSCSCAESPQQAVVQMRQEPATSAICHLDCSGEGSLVFARHLESEQLLGRVALGVVVCSLFVDGGIIEDLSRLGAMVHHGVLRKADLLRLIAQLNAR